jgi:hypothetical protein
MNTLRFTKLLRLALLSLALVASLVLAGCNVSGAPSSGSNNSTSSPTTITSSDPSNPGNTSADPGNASPTGTTAPEVGIIKIARTLSNNPAVTFRYAGIDFTVKKALITNELPHFQGRYSDTDTTIYLTLSGSNDSKDFARITSGLLTLTLDGNQYKKPLATGIQSRDTGSVAFEWDNVPLATDWKGAALNINEENKEPVTVTLDDPQPSTYPIMLTPGADAVAGSYPITYSVTLAQIGLDGISSNSLMEQADQGSRFVTIKFSATNQTPNRDAYLAADYATLLADGKPVKPDYLDPAADAIKPLNTSKFTAWYVVPADTKSLVLEVGDADNTAQIPLAMP